MTEPPDLAGIAASYDRVAAAYAEAFFDELERKPLDRALLDGFAAELAGSGAVCDLGCGPGQVARYLVERGVEVFGLDLSREMVAVARRRNPHLCFRQGDLLALEVADGAWAGIVAFYSLIHVPRRAVPAALAELRRVLRPDGVLLLAVHGGSGEVQADEWFGQPVQLAATLFEPDELVAALQDAGFVVSELQERPPYDFEYQSRRLYLSARLST